MDAGEGKLRRFWKAGLGSGPYRPLPLSLSLEGSLDWTGTAETGESSGYAEAWLQSWAPLFPGGGEDAELRENQALFKAALGTLPLGAEFFLEGTSSSSRAQNSARPGGTLGLEFPLRAGNYRLSLRGERRYFRRIEPAGEDLGDDGRQWAESLVDFGELLLSVPGYSLFAGDQGARLEAALASPGGGEIFQGRFEDRYSLRFSAPARYDPLALLIPGRVEFQVSRILERRLDTRLDLLNPGFVLNYSAINLFGGFGAVPLFSFYRNDELSRRLEAAWTLPQGEKPSWRIRETERLSFYGWAGAELDFAATLSLGSPDKDRKNVNGSGNLQVEWTVPAPRSLLGLFYERARGLIQSRSSWVVLGGLAGALYEQLRRETLELTFEYTQDYPRLVLGLNHESIIRIPGRLDLSVFAGLDCGQDWRSEILLFSASAGFSLSLRF
jgi:hypothetical protein